MLTQAAVLRYNLCCNFGTIHTMEGGSRSLKGSGSRFLYSPEIAQFLTFSHRSAVSFAVKPLYKNPLARTVHIVEEMRSNVHIAVLFFAK